MTVVVGVADGRSVVLGADSAVTYGDLVVEDRAGKVFEKGGLLLGTAGSVHLCQALEYEIPVRLTRGEDLAAEVFRGVVVPVRSWLEEHEVEGEDRDLSVLVGVRGRLFLLEDLGLHEAVDAYDAIGSGMAVALGALHATAPLGLPARERVDRALAATERHCLDIRGPFRVLEA